MKQIVVIGGGFAGLWSAVGAARKLDELHLPSREVQVTLINRDAYHAIRVRNYEHDLSDVRVPLDQVLTPVGIRRIEGTVTAIDCATQQVTADTSAGKTMIPYDRLVLAAGSQLYRPDIPGLREHAFSVDTYAEAVRLNEHVRHLPRRPDVPGRYTVLVVGAGLTGIETACEMPDKLRAAAALGRERAGKAAEVRVVLADHSPRVGSDMGESARPVIEEALAALGIESRMGVTVQAIDEQGVSLGTGERIAAQTVVWTAGMRAHPLTRLFPDGHDNWGRLFVDEYMRVIGTQNMFAAGDVASAPIDGVHASVMSCQHGRPMGRFAGHNVVCDLLGRQPLPLRIDWYVTVLDLGPWGAVYTHGWDRHVVAQGAQAKRTKAQINRVRIYPPRSGNRQEILEAAAPAVQSPPERYY